jgi:hypothetical protein
MVHPYKDEDEDTDIDEMEQITVTLELCTLYNGLPHGIAVISHSNENEYDSFRGLGVFVHGKLHNAPFTCVDGSGSGISCSNMQNGRPADGSY